MDNDVDSAIVLVRNVRREREADSSVIVCLVSPFEVHVKLLADGARSSRLMESRHINNIVGSVEGCDR